MLSYEVKSGRECLIDGLGKFEAGETRTFSEDEVRLFEALQGRPLARANFPSDVQVAVLVEPEKTEEVS